MSVYALVAVRGVFILNKCVALRMHVIFKCVESPVVHFKNA